MSIDSFDFGLIMFFFGFASAFMVIAVGVFFYLLDKGRL